MSRKLIYYPATKRQLLSLTTEVIVVCGVEWRYTSDAVSCHFSSVPRSRHWLPMSLFQQDYRWPPHCTTSRFRSNFCFIYSRIVMLASIGRF